MLINSVTAQRMVQYIKNYFPFHGTYSPQALTMGTCLKQLWLWTGWLVLFCRPTQKTALTYMQSSEMIWKKWRWTDQERKLRTGKKYLAAAKACTAIFWPTPGFQGRTHVHTAWCPGWTVAGRPWSAAGCRCPAGSPSCVRLCADRPTCTPSWPPCPRGKQAQVRTSSPGTIHWDWSTQRP